QDALLQRCGRAGADVLNRHGRLQRRDALYRAETCARLRRAAVDDARLVEVDVGFDQARTGEAALRVIRVGLRRDRLRDRHDAPVRDADIVRRAAPIRQPRIADDEVHKTRLFVMAGLVPAIHVLLAAYFEKTWMHGPRPGMTKVGVTPP